MIITVAIIILGYCLLLLSLLMGWQSLPCATSNGNQGNLTYSILIPVRNEASRLLALLDSLDSLKFPIDRFEIIFIDDHSEDGSVDLIQEWMRKTPFTVQLLRLTAATGKKSALKKGIDQSTRDIIVTTDADCRVSPAWLSSINKYYTEYPAKLVFGPVTFSPTNSVFHKLQTVEFAGLIGTGASGISLGLPNMCNGANFSFSRDWFHQLGGYSGHEHIPSGDDEFLMHKFYQQDPASVYFNKSLEGVVFTQAIDSLGEFFNQRKRWAGKWKNYTDPKTTGLAVVVFLSNLAFIAAIGVLIGEPEAYEWLAIPIFLKVCLELIFLKIMLHFFKKKISFIYFLLLQFTYPFYVIFFGIAANFGKYTWKGRRH